MIVQVHSQGILVDLRAASGGIWVRVVEHRCYDIAGDCWQASNAPAFLLRVGQTHLRFYQDDYTTVEQEWDFVVPDVRYPARRICNVHTPGAGLKVSLLLNEKFQRDIESVAEAAVIRAGAYWRIPGVRRRFESLPEAEDMWRYLFGPSNRVPDFSEVPLTVESPKKLSPKLTQWERLLTDASE